MKNLFINKKKWSLFSESELDDYVAAVFDYFRREGFPYFPSSVDWRFLEHTMMISSS